MASVVFRVWVGVGENSTSGTPYGCNIRLPTAIKSTNCTVNIVIRDSSLNNGGYLTSSGAGTHKSDYYLCDSNGNNAVFIQTFSHNGGASIQSNNNAVSVNLRSLAGKAVYMKEITTSGSGIHIRGDCAVVLNYATYTKPSVAAGEQITEAKMDALRLFINKGTDVAAGGSATAAVGNTYYSGLTAQQTKFDDTWFNTAANQGTTTTSAP